MILLDTNVVSALMYEVPELAVLRWLDLQPRSSVWITSITIMEIRYGIEILAQGRRRQSLLADLETFLRTIAGRVAPFDSHAADKTAELMALRRKKGRTVDLRDTMIAGIALANDASIATRNVGHFDDLTIAVLNPWAP